MRLTTASILIGCSVLVPVSESTAEVSEKDVRDFTERSLIVVAYHTEAGPVAKAVRSADVPTPERVACARDSPEVAVALAVATAAMCLDIQDPASGPTATTTHAAEEVESWLRALPAERLKTADGTLTAEVGGEAETRYREALRRSGLTDRIVAAWRRHVVEGSECARGVEAQMQGILASLAIDCNHIAWDRILQICNSRSRSVLAHIVTRKATLPIPERQLTALDQLMNRGLLYCLADLAERHAPPELQEAVKSHGLDAADGDGERLTQELWKVWREQGVEGWLDATMQAGEVPGPVAEALESCAGPTKVFVGGQAPPIDVVVSGEARLKVASPPGRFVLIAFWASWCAPCHDELADLSRAAETLKREQAGGGPALDFLAINSSEKPEDVRAMTERFAGVTFGFDPDGKIAEAWGVRGLPSTFLVDPAGKVVQAMLGANPRLGEQVLEVVRAAGHTGTPPRAGGPVGDPEGRARSAASPPGRGPTD